MLKQAREAFEQADAQRADRCYTQLFNSIDQNHPDYAECLECLIVIKKELREWGSAREYSQRLITLGESMLGPDHSAVALWRKELATIQSKIDEGQLGRPKLSTGYESVQDDGYKTIVSIPKDKGQTAPQTRAPEPYSFNPQQQTQQQFDQQQQSTTGSARADFTDEQRAAQSGTQQNRAKQSLTHQSRTQQSRTGQSQTKAPYRTGGGLIDGPKIKDRDEPEGENVYVAADEPEEPKSAASRKFQMSEQDYRDREEMYAAEARERNDNVLRAVLICLSTGMIVSAAYFFWDFAFGPAAPSSASRNRTSPDGLRAAKYTSNRRISYTFEKRNAELGYSGFALGVDEYCRSLPAAIFGKEFWMQEKQEYLIDEDGTIYLDEECATSATVNNMRQLADLARIYKLHMKTYPADLSLIAANKMAGDNESAKEKASDTTRGENNDDAGSGTTSGASSSSGAGGSDSAAGDGAKSDKTQEDGAKGDSDDMAAQGSADNADTGAEKPQYLVENSSTHAQEVPAYLHAELAVTANNSKQVIDETLEKLKNGGSFPGEQPLKAGQFSACLYDIKGPASGGQLLVIHGADTVGKLIAGAGVHRTYLKVLLNGEDYDNPDRTSPLGRAFLGIGPRFEIRAPYISVLDFEHDFPIPLWLMRFRFILPAIFVGGCFAALGHFSSANVNRWIGYGMGGLCVLAALLSLLNAILP